MNKAKIKYLIIIIALSLSLIVSFGFIFKKDSSYLTKAESPEITFGESTFSIEETYDLNSEVEFPSLSNIKVGEYSATQHILIAPDGQVFSPDGLVVFDKLGLYTYQVYYNKDGKPLYESKEFTVNSDSISSGLGSASIEYKTLQKAFGDVTEGVAVTIAQDDTITYNRPINLKKSGPTSIITLKNYSLDTDYNLYIKLTDCYDLDNYIEIWFYAKSVGYDLPRYWFCASFLGGNQAGFEFRNENLNGYTNFTYDDPYTLSDESSKVCANRFAGGALNAKQADGYVTFTYDAETQISGYAFNAYEPIKIINDFKCSDLYYGANVFNGFSSDMVYVSVTARQNDSNVYKGESKAFDKVSFEISDIGGNTLTDFSLKDNVKYIDTSAPELKVNFDGEVAYAAKDCAFPLFDVEAIDLNLKTVYSEVYCNYGTANEFMVSNNGKEFIPKCAGRYTIVYTALDMSGNKTTATVPVICIETATKALINFDKTQSYFDNMIARAGYRLRLPNIDEMGISSLNGAFTCKVEAIYNGVSYELDSDLSFIPLELGDWDIVYTVKDSVCTIEKHFSLYVGSSDAVCFMETPAFPKYFIKNAKYSLEDFALYSFNGGKKQVDADIYVSFDGEDFNKVNGLIDKISGSSTVQIQYKVGDKIVYTSEEIEIVDVGFKDTNSFAMSKYFKGDFTSEAGSSGITFTSSVSSGNNTLNFIKEIYVTDFEFHFSNVVSKEIEGAMQKLLSNHNVVEIKLTDYYNSNRNITLRLEKTSDGLASVFSVNGKSSAVLAPSFSNARTSIKYDSNLRAFVCGDARVEIDIPFESGKCYISVSLCGISGDAWIVINQINKQMLNKNTSDKVAPQLNFSYENNAQELNSIYTITKPEVIDVLSPVIAEDVTVRVAGPSGNVINSIDGVALSDVVFDRDYQFKLTEIGTYSIEISYKDVSGRKADFTGYFDVLITDKPKIEFENGDKAGETVECKLNDEVEFKSVKVEDKFDSGLVVEISVIEPYGAIHTVYEDTYYATKVGRYKVVYKVLTSDGRYSTTYYYLQVK